MEAVRELIPTLGTKKACQSVNISRASFYRLNQVRSKSTCKVPRSVAKSIRTLSDSERTQVLEVLNSERFMDKAPSEVYATLLDEGIYLCSIRTMYRILAKEAQVCERRNLSLHPVYKKPELLAT